MEQATEIEYLRWFHANAFQNNPLGDKLIALSQQQFTRETGKSMPDAYTPDES